MPLQEIRFKRLGVFQREQGGREHHFAQKRDRFFPEFAFLFIGNFLVCIFGDAVAGNYFGQTPAATIKNDEILILLAN